MSHTLKFKNKKTGKTTSIKQHELNIFDWGFNFLVETELEAYQAVYQYSLMKYPPKIEYSESKGMWLITVFHNYLSEELAKSFGLT